MATRGEYAKGRARRAQILTEAAAVFAESGYRAASLRDLAARCGLSHAGLLHHFGGTAAGGKAALLLAVLEQRDEQDATTADLLTGTGRERLDALVEVVRRNTGRRGIVELFTVLSAEATAADHPAHAFFAERYRRIVTAVADAFADCGHPRPRSAARRLVAVLDGLQVQWLTHPDEVDMVAEVRAQIDAELRGVMARGDTAG